jgi:hypothetical protein
MILFIRDDSDSGSLMGDIEGCPWNRRGWTMQERSLSTRILHFCKNKLYFECRTCIASEENEGLQKLRFFHMWPRNEDWMHQPAGNASESADDATTQKKWYERWTQIISEYSRRSLTKDFDKLPAIQGIAAEMSANIHDTYIPFAGMWKHNLKHDLLWQFEDSPVLVPSKYRAPTWSWASLDAKVIWSKGHVSPSSSHSSISRALFEVLIISDNAEMVEGNHFLKVRAFLKPLSFASECDYDDRWFYGDRGVFPYDLFVPAPSTNLTVALESLAASLSLGDRHGAIENRHFVKFAEARLDLDDKDGLTMSQRRLSYLHVDNACRPSGLILEPVKGANGIWRRVGVATIFGKWSNLFVEACFAENEESVQVTIV